MRRHKAPERHATGMCLEFSRIGIAYSRTVTPMSDELTVRAKKTEKTTFIERNMSEVY